MPSVTAPAVPSTRRRSARTLLAALLLGTAFAACGDDDSSDAELVDERSEAELADDLALAESILLTEDDFPSGWELDEDDEGDETDDAEDEELDAQLYECVGVDRSEVFDNENALAEGSDYKAPTSGVSETYAGSEVQLYPTEEYARAAFAPFEDPDFESCFRELGAQAIEEDAAEDDSGVQFDDVSVERLDFPDLGDGTVAYRITLTLAFEGVSIESNIDFVAILAGRVGITLDYGTIGGAFDPALAKELANTIVDRAEAA